MKLLLRLTATALLLTAVAVPAPWQAAMADDQEKPASESEATKETKYWIGVQLMPTPKLLRDHVKKLKNGSATIAGIAQESPASKAKLKRGDHVIAIDGTGIASPENLVEAVANMKAKPFRLEVLRGTETLEVEVTPEVMPELKDRKPVLGPDVSGDRLRLFGPGRVVPKSMKFSLLPKDLPQNILIRMEQRGDEPVKLHIERDGETWDVSEDEIDQLPEDLQAIAKQRVGNVRDGMEIVGGSEIPLKDVLGMMKMRSQLQDHALPTLDMNEIQKQMQEDMEELRNMMRELRSRYHDQIPEPTPIPEGDEV